MKFTLNPVNSTISNNDKKETIKAWNLVAFKDGKFIDLVTVRWYMGRSSTASTVYCSVWIHSQLFDNSHGQWTDASGSGKALGGGYCKMSAAFEHAMHQAGVICDQEISGRGMSVVEDALIALATQAKFEHIKLCRG